MNQLKQTLAVSIFFLSIGVLLPVIVGVCKVALKLQQRFCPEPGKSRQPEKPAPPQKAEPKDERPVVVNQPLDFELNGLDIELRSETSFVPSTASRKKFMRRAGVFI